MYIKSLSDLVKYLQSVASGHYENEAICGVKLTHRLCKQQNKEAAYGPFFIIYSYVHGLKFDGQP